MNCKQCNNDLTGKREGAIFCSEKCRNKQFKRKARIKNKINKIQKQLKSNKDFINHLEKQIKEQKEQFESQFVIAKKKFKKAESLYRLFLHVKKLNYDQFCRFLVKQILEEKLIVPSEDHDVAKYGGRYDKEYLAERYSRKFEDNHEKVKWDYFDSKEELSKLDKSSKEEHWKSEEARIEKAKLENVEFEQELEKLKAIDLNNLPFQLTQETFSKSKKENRPLNIRGYSGSEILSMQFDTLELGGELGTFFGKLQRERCAIALTGDSGAGKSTFSYQIAKAFLERQQSVAYFSLEAGFTESMKELIDKFDIEQYNFKAYAEGRLSDVRSLASQFDCVFVDSYSKISSNASDFEELRQDFPNTFFIIIFQKTTDGKPRGGSSILYNSTATIDIQLTKHNHRIAFMQKSRYDTENYVFSINQNKVLKANKIPIKWTEIKEKWALP